MDIDEAIIRFENINEIDTSDYCTEEKREKKKIIDNLISSQVFKDRVEHWLDMNDDPLMKEEFLLLLTKYRYLPEDEYRWRIWNMVDEIINDSSVDISRILFLLFPSKKYCESGCTYVNAALEAYSRGKIKLDNIRIFAALSDLKDRSEEPIIEEQLMQNQMPTKAELLLKYTKDIKVDLDVFDAVVFMDDIIGSGSTLYKHVKAFVKAYPQINEKKVYISCLCKNENLITEKVNEIRKKLVHIDKVVCSINQEKCYEEQKISNNYEMVKKYEDLIELNKTDEEKHSCSMGFDNGQFLISFYYNTPNNTLSLFWRLTDVSKYPLFIRNRQSYSLDDLKKQSFQNEANAFNMGNNSRG